MVPSGEHFTNGQSRVLSSRQQDAAAVVLVICIAVMLASWGMKWLRYERMIDIEQPFVKRPVVLSIDLNRSEWPELTLLPEISETMARRIVEFRDAQGRFESLDELMQVRGIGPRTFEQVRHYLEPISPLDQTRDQRHQMVVENAQQ